MKPQKDEKWLDSALSRVIGSGKPQFDADRWKEQYLKKELRKKQTAKHEPNIWRIIMKSRITKLAAAAVIIIATLISINLFNGTPAWAIEQSVKALDNIETLVISGEAVVGRPRKFTGWIKRDEDDRNSFRGRVESGEIVGVICDNIAYNYIKGCREIYAYDMEETGGQGVGTKLWYHTMKNAPWVLPIAPTMLKAIQLMASDWQEIYEKDEQSGRECVFVTGSYKAFSASFWIVFDLETKMIVRAKYWLNPDRQGRPDLNIEKVIYNKEVSNEIFDLEKLTGAKVININIEQWKQRWTLWRQAIELDRKRQYAEAIKAYQELYEKYPQFEKTPEALVLIAICYREMGQYNNAIQYFKKVPREYSAPRYAICDAHRLLGHCYMLMGEDAKALKAFDNCLELIEQWDPEKVEWEKTRELIKKDIKKIKDRNK